MTLIEKLLCVFIVCVMAWALAGWIA